MHNLNKQVGMHKQTYMEASWSSYNMYYKCPEGCEKSLQVIFPTARRLESSNLNNIIKYSKKKAGEIHDRLKVKYDFLEKE